MSIVSNEQIIKAIRQYNPWWQNIASIKEKSKAHKRNAYYSAIKVLMHQTIKRFVVLSGARRVGKTTIIYQMIENLIENGVNPKNIFYISFDNPLIKTKTVDTIISIYQTLYPLEGTKYIFFDEIQYTDNWELWMKVIYDTHPDIRLTATGSASPIIEKGAADSGTGRWRVLRIPTLSFYEYCELLDIAKPPISQKIYLSDYAKIAEHELADLTAHFEYMTAHFNRYLTVGGFPELALADDDAYAQSILREDVVDKVIKRDVLTLFNIRNPILMEKLFLYLCMNTTEIFSASTAAKELDNTSVLTIETYIKALEMSNLIYVAKPINVASKGALKGKPKIFIADSAIRNAVLMIDDVLADEVALGKMVEMTVYKQLHSFYQGTAVQLGYFRKAKDNQKEVDIVVKLPSSKLLFEVKYRNHSQIPESAALVELLKDKSTNAGAAFLITKKLSDCGKASHKTMLPIIKVPALVFLYMLGWEEADTLKGKI